MFHTPLCPKRCSLRHHDVITALQAVAPKFSSSAVAVGGPLRVTRGNNKEDFKKQVHKLLSTGWTKDEVVPEPSEHLRLPLLHLASMFGKHEIVEWLLDEKDHDVKLRTGKSDETALHLVARHLYTALSAGESRLENMSITAKVANFERIVSLLIDREVTLFWAKTDRHRETVFHILAGKMLAVSADNDHSETEDACLSFYSKSFDVALKLLLAEEKYRLHRRDVKMALGIKNSEGNTALHLLAKARHKGYLVLKFLVKTLGNNDLLRLKNAAGLTAIDIVNQVYPGHEKDLLVDEEAKRRPKVVNPYPQTPAQKEQELELTRIIQNSNTNAVAIPSQQGNVVPRLATRPDGCVIHTPLFPGGNSVQEPVSSSVTPFATLNHRNMNIAGSIEINSGNSLPCIPVVHVDSSTERPQAQVQSIQLQGHALETGNPSLQGFPLSNPAPHIPVIFIKREPSGAKQTTQGLLSMNNQAVGPLQEQTFIFKPTSTMTAVRQANPLPVKTVSAMAVQPLPYGNVPQHSSLASQSSRLQGTSYAVTRKEQTSALSAQPTPVTGQPTTQMPSDNRSLQHVQQENNKSQPERQALPQSMEKSERRKATIEEMAWECLNNLDGTYTTDCLHTPLCDESCNVDHSHLVLTMYCSSNKRNPKGKNAFTQLVECSKNNFLLCLKKNLNEGMAKDVEVSDGLDRLKYPLVHLAAMFYRYVAIEILACLGFDQNVRSPRTGEFPLHSTLRHNYETGLKIFKTIGQPGFNVTVFSKVLDSLSCGCDVMKVFTQQDHNGDTPLHVAAKMMVDRPAVATCSSDTRESGIPDSTQECNMGNSNARELLSNPSLGCKLEKVSEEDQLRAEFYTRCMQVMLRKIRECCMRSRKLVIDLAKPVLLMKNNSEETFLQILCTEHHVAAECISAVMSRFPLDDFMICAKASIPTCCWAVCIPVESTGNSTCMSDVAQTETTSCPKEFSETSKRQQDLQTSKPESPKPSTDVSEIPASAMTSNVESVKSIEQEVNSAPIPATPTDFKTSNTDMDVILEAAITPVVANSVHSSLRPNTKRKIINALREDYVERLELAVKGKCEVEEDVLKHRQKIGELREAMAQKEQAIQRLQKELHELQKEDWHAKQAVQALENSLEQFTKEEKEMEKNLAVLQGADPEPPAKRNKNSSEPDTRL